ncbi:hypothetical protein KHC33_07830 [Methanospirillum sp. J.3.6.1-F.2.7.3]|uniref:Uncharacterized protein n=1 Tax=Methanospirillum purgamenti TaxID=2834276 RepID=A0A8E7AZQ4_9EURY|nr:MULTISPECIES: hypothetical protein [Methanospirillum]MDX8550229.1 hypothetical protein [Methanospirillum hungatei]QVV90380.1 hypothetical protein KHC33_07830 [Methanospirillum sp. J.3.6.1-F.2.7.3]
MTVNQNPEQIARDTINRKLIESGFAVREYPTDALLADYVLFMDRVSVGIIEAV